MLTPILTALLAVLVFVLTQSFLKLVLEPIQEQRRLIGEVAHALVFYANVYHVTAFGTPDERRIEELEEARKALRNLAGQLRASLWTVPFYDALARVGWVPRKQDVLEAATQLIGWSTSLYGSTGDGAREKRRTIIADRLGITKLLEEAS